MKFQRYLDIILAGLALPGLCACASAPQPPPEPVANAVSFTGDAFELSEVDVLPLAVTQGPPNYPWRYREPGGNGRAVIAFILDTDGTVKQAQVVSASAKEFGEAARAAVQRWRFRPARKGGVPVRVRMTVPIEFHFNG